MHARRDPPATNKEIEDLLLPLNIDRDLLRHLVARREPVSTLNPSPHTPLATLLNHRGLNRQIVSGHQVKQLQLTHNTLTHATQSFLLRL